MKQYIFSDLAYETSFNKLNKNEKNIYKISERMKKIRFFSRENQSSDGHNDFMCTTFLFPKILEISDNEFDMLVFWISEEIKYYIQKALGEDIFKQGFSALTVGLGNPAINADSLGTRVVKKLAITRNNKGEANKILLSAISPNVMGNTGIETAEAILGYVNTVKPDILILIDSLAARDTKRLASVIQISNRGLIPGGGIGEGKRAISENELNIPIISVGIPTVINTFTLVENIISDIGFKLTEGEREELFKKNQNFFVTLKDIDIAVEASALLLSHGINTVLASE